MVNEPSMSSADKVALFNLGRDMWQSCFDEWNSVGTTIPFMSSPDWKELLIYFDSELKSYFDDDEIEIIKKGLLFNVERYPDEDTSGGK